MFRKIHSNRNPRDTLYSELKKEWRPYLVKIRPSLKKITQRYPKFLFAMMVINILLSIVLVVSLHREPPKKPSPAIPLNTGFDRLLQTGEALKKTIVLKRQVDSIMTKKQLSAQDSGQLESALDQLQKMKNKSHEHQFQTTQIRPAAHSLSLFVPVLLCLSQQRR